MATTADHSRELFKFIGEHFPGLCHEQACILAKEYLIAEDINRVIGDDVYYPSPRRSEKGIDLLAIDRDRYLPVQFPVIQSKVTRTIDGKFSFGSRVSVSDVGSKAMARDPKALVSFARMEDEKILEHVIGPALLLLGLRNLYNDNFTHYVEMWRLRKLGFQDLQVFWSERG